jgi:hypothetical protein
MLVQPDGEEHPLARSAFWHWRWPPRLIGCLVREHASWPVEDKNNKSRTAEDGGPLRELYFT